MGHKQTEESKEKNRQWHLGRKHSLETIAKMKGRKAWNKGLSAPWAKNNKQTFKKGHIPWNKGIKIEFNGFGIKKGQHISPSTEFKSEQVTGKNNVNWKGGVTPKNEKIRKSKDYIIWRTAVFMRDDYTCQSCGQKGGTLNADHIKSFAQYPELRFAIDNGRTLCIECHRKTDTWGSQEFLLTERNN